MSVGSLLTAMKTSSPPVFTFLGEGVTTKAYLSPCQQYVIKILKTPEEAADYYLKNIGQEIKTNYAVSDKGRDNNHVAATEILSDVERSLGLAWKRLKQATGLILKHQRGEPLPFDKIVINTKEGKLEALEKLNNKCFYLQHKVKLLNEDKDPLTPQNTDTVKEGFDDWLSFQQKLWAMRPTLVNSDISGPDHNYGYLNGHLICIDVGGFSDDPDVVKFQLSGKYVLYPEMHYAQYLAKYGLSDYVRAEVNRAYDSAYIAYCEQAEIRVLEQQDAHMPSSHTFFRINKGSDVSDEIPGDILSPPTTTWMLK